MAPHHAGGRLELDRGPARYLGPRGDGPWLGEADGQRCNPTAESRDGCLAHLPSARSSDRKGARHQVCKSRQPAGAVASGIGRDAAGQLPVRGGPSPPFWRRPHPGRKPGELVCKSRVVGGAPGTGCFPSTRRQSQRRNHVCILPDAHCRRAHWQPAPGVLCGITGGHGTGRHDFAVRLEANRRMHKVWFLPLDPKFPGFSMDPSSRWWRRNAVASIQGHPVSPPGTARHESMETRPVRRLLHGHVYIRPSSVGSGGLNLFMTCHGRDSGTREWMSGG
ncbi:hypothetical protein QBC39DRAFT_436788 [Podospora conica]|nr:hypothetical protein QBC39DRAFT_436788 [Schizothecium conicum]